MSGIRPGSVACPKCGVKLSKYERKRRLFWQWALFSGGRRYKCHGCGKSSFIRNINSYLKKTNPSYASQLENERRARKNATKKLTTIVLLPPPKDPPNQQKQHTPQNNAAGDTAARQIEAKAGAFKEAGIEQDFFSSLIGYLTDSTPSQATRAINNRMGSNITPVQQSEPLMPTSTVSTSNRQEIRALLNFPNRFIRYQNTTTVEEEIETAKTIHIELQSVINGTMTNLHESRHIEVESIKKSTRKLIESMIRNPDAIFLLSKLKGTQSIAYTHCVDAAILAIFFGRHMGLTQQELNTLALGTLLLDIGKTQLPQAVLEKPSKLAYKEIMLLQKHVQFSLDILGDNDIGADVLSIIDNHHERYDGRGYPQHKQKMEIPFLAKIATIVDAYSAMTHHRPYRNALPPSTAIEILQQQRGLAFQAELIDEFTYCLGVYPIGSMVILSTGEAGIVISQNQVRRLQPKVLIFRDNRKDKVIAPFMRDLEIESLGEDGKPVFIKAA